MPLGRRTQRMQPPQCASGSYPMAGCESHTRAPCFCLHRTKTGTLLYYTPGSGEHGPRFLTGGPGAAPGGVASKNGWVYMRVQGGFDFYSRKSLSVCVSQNGSFFFENGLRERLRVCRGEPRNPLRGLKEGGQAMRGAMLCLSADLTTHAVYNFSPSLI